VWDKKEVILSAIDAVIIINKEAGVNTDSLTGLVSGGKEKSDFDEFCIACVHVFQPLSAKCCHTWARKEL
jgi:hypothetical protein